MYYDVAIFRAMNGLANQSAILNSLIVFFADYLPYLMVLFLFSFLLWSRLMINKEKDHIIIKEKKIKNGKMILVVMISVFISRFIIRNIILLFYHRPRPYITMTSANKLISLNPIENFQSFPSGHAIFFFSMAMAVYLYNKRLGGWFFIATILVSMSRIIAGVHYISDILAGAIIGILVSYIVFYIFEKYNKSIV